MPATPVHVIVLAAGRGSRLGALGDATPKWLLPVAGRTLADRHLEGIGRGAAVASVSVVVGHAARAIEDELAARPETVRIVHNPEFAELNNWWSLLRALRGLPEDGPVAVLNADLLIDPERVGAFLDDAAAGDADGLLVVDLEREVTDESMKVSQDAGGRLDRIGKVDVPEAAGEFIGMLMARGTVLRRLRAELEGFVGRPECAAQWYEGAVGRTAAAGARWDIWPLASGDWVEIDDAADLGAAESLAGAR